jgi:hypothetical protein
VAANPAASPRVPHGTADRERCASLAINRFSLFRVLFAQQVVQSIDESLELALTFDQRVVDGGGVLLRLQRLVEELQRYLLVSLSFPLGSAGGGFEVLKSSRA